MTLRARLFLALVAISVVLVLPAIFASDRLHELREIAVELREEETAAADALSTLRTSLDRTDRHARSWVATLDPAAGRRLHRAMDGARSALAELRRRGHGESSTDARALLAAVEAAVAGLDSVARAARSDGTVTGAELEAATDRFRYLPPLLVATRQSLETVERSLRRRSELAVLRAEAISRQAAESTVLALVLALGVAVLVALVITRIVARPVDRLRVSMRRVAGGDFTPPGDLDYDRGDELGELHRAFRSMTERLAELDRMKSEFVSLASHRLRTPIDVLRGYAEMFAGGDFGPLTDLERDALEEMREQIEDLSGQVDELVELSRAEAGTLRVEPEEVPVADLLAGVREDFRAQARQKGVDFAVVTAASAPETVEADPDRIRNEVLGNFLSAAFRAVDGGGRVRVTARGEEERLVLEVADTGPGLPPDELEHVFEKYRRVEDAGDGPGPGLGLSIAREIVHRHDGEIDAESVVGRGTVYRARLPVRQEERGQRSTG